MSFYRLVVVGALVALTWTQTDTLAAQRFPPASPESVGLRSAGLRQAVDRMQEWFEEGRMVGAELHVIKDGRTVLHEVVGWRDREREIPWEQNTICRIRSMTKPWVGTSILMLWEAGMLELGDPVATYLPSFDNPRSRDITIEQLLTHTGGFSQPGYPRALSSFGSLREAVDAAGAAGPDAAPGTVYQYSDAGSATLGALVAALTGMPAEEFIRQRLVDPLGLENTLLNLPLDDPRRPRVSSTYQGIDGAYEKYWENTAPQALPFFRASGGIYTTTTDYARFLSMWMRGGAIDGVRFLSPETVRRALHPGPFDVAERGYGFQWELFENASPDSGDLPAFGHGGSDGTIAMAVPSRDLMVLYFTQSRGGRTTREMVDLLLESIDEN